MSDSRANPDAAVARFAARQHGVASVAQLHALGLDKHAIRHRARTGRLHRVHMGVYAVGYARLTFEGRCLAAALACGPGAVVSHRSAAALWGMLCAPAGWIEISISTTSGRKQRRGIVVHRSSSLAAGLTASGKRLVVERNSIPVTTPARTLRDLKRTAPEEVVQRAFRRALDLRLVQPGILGPEPDLTRSGLERRFLALCRRHRLPRPEVNARIDIPAEARVSGGPSFHEVDFLWRERRVVVETDGWRHHSDRAAFERDRGRDARLQAAGYRVLRFTYGQVVRDGRAVAAAVRAVLVAPNLPGPGRSRRRSS